MDLGVRRMGTLVYGSLGISISFEDRALMHLQIVITAKLRRRESFVFSWVDTADAHTGRNAIWLDPASTLHYRYRAVEVPPINRQWIDALMLSANTAGGLVFVAEPGATTDTAPPVSATASAAPARAHS